MKKILWFALFLSWFALPAQAQMSPFSALLRGSTASVYAAPVSEGAVIASVYGDSALEVVGRSLDGTWFEVRRPGRLTSLGWVTESALDWEFAPEQLPLTDMSSGVVGAEVLDRAPEDAAYVLEAAALRIQPLSTADTISAAPFNVTLPILERNQDASWLRVYYLGTTGWLPAGALRPSATMTVPQARNLPPLEGTSLLTVPLDLQLEQVNRLRDYLTASRDLSEGLAGLWWSVYQGDVMPCEPPPFVGEYLYSTADVRQLPELTRITPQADRAAQFVNESIEALYICGVVNPEIATEARNDAINARVSFDAALGTLANIESVVCARREASCRALQQPPASTTP